MKSSPIVTPRFPSKWLSFLKVTVSTVGQETLSGGYSKHRKSDNIQNVFISEFVLDETKR